MIGQVALAVVGCALVFLVLALLGWQWYDAPPKPKPLRRPTVADLIEKCRND